MKNKEQAQVEKKKSGPSFTTWIMIAVVVGAALGLLAPQIAGKIKFIGDIFLRLMQMAIPLLVLGQIIQAIADIDLDELPTIGVRTIVVFFVSSLLAAGFGVLVGHLLKPGQGVQIPETSYEVPEAPSLNFIDALVEFFPSNIMESLSNGVIIQIIFFAIFAGIAVNKYMIKNPDSLVKKNLLDFNDVVMDIIGLVMNFAPIGIFALVAGAIGDVGLDVIKVLLKYLLTFILATVVFMILWLIVIQIKTGLSMFEVQKRLKDVSVMSLATTSSAITLPLAMKDSEEKLGLSQRVTNFVLPLGMSLNSNGSAMHMALTVVTISQMYNIPFTTSQMVYLAFLATFVSLANAVVPGAGLVSLATIVPQMGLPVESIAIFAGIEWFVGMTRTILNVNSDIYSAILVADTLEEIDKSIY